MRDQSLQETSLEMKKDILQLCYRLGENAGHLGGCMSITDLLNVLYKSCLDWSIDQLHDENRARIILSKGHGSIAYYAAMHQYGLIHSLQDMHSLLGQGNVYYKQVVRNQKFGLEFSSGSLGQGLAYAVGVAWALKQKQSPAQVYVFMGDGECDEGSVWEAASIAGHLKLDNITVVIDRNGLQIDGFTKDINSMKMLPERFQSFGFRAIQINGHDFDAIEQAYHTVHEEQPLAIIADTIKGKHISFAENKAEWHQKPLTEELYAQALMDLERAKNVGI